MRITFLGAAGTVTGSKYLVEAAGKRLLIDCGLFQGFKNLRLRNREPLSVNPATIDAVILTHAHIDHSGYLPLLVRDGYKGPVFTSRATAALCGILLPDSGHLQERDAEFANRHGFSKHSPALPLYTEEDARLALKSLREVSFEESMELGDGVSFTLRRAGHILGAAMVELRAEERSLLFSGDLGRPNDPVMLPPTVGLECDYLVVESTYGNRRHPDGDVEEKLADVINQTVSGGGSVLIPSFAVGRTQALLYHLHQLKQTGRIANVPVYLDSPMAIDASELFLAHHDEHRLTAAESRSACRAATFVRDVEGSKALDRSSMPLIIISASGMATGGRVLHHLKHFAPDPKNTILFAGFQAGGTRGADMAEGANRIKIHGYYYPLRAKVEMLDMLSAHADYFEILAWLTTFKRAPRTTFVTHGEPAAADALRHSIEEALGWRCRVPDYRDAVTLE
ncbi:MBL fold metallo-hydrolase RNA specificity domain-containing protein [Limibacillus halophilus]|uniref:Metallo-beta-lactamase family protein n=1 Tax=Limibacillus halophilus TaxID=1579333 RepID=A0A839SYZ5_9PROT|nr:MBL fold metallo-hydrolase [Limibacillus halophilus]MBB3066265.1 metallo-beta-lactamase family protein [Limibacillus halophilus]